MSYRFAAGALIAGLIAAVALSAGCQDLLNQIGDLVISTIDRVGPPPQSTVYTAKPFVNWETPHVAPLALSPDGTLLAAVNTPAARVELFNVGAAGLVAGGAIPVGLDPVTARFRSDGELWVVNHVSDSVSVVDVAGRQVTRTLYPGDEPTDVVFAQGRAFVVCSQQGYVAVYDLANLDAPPAKLTIDGAHPRSLAVSPDGKTVYVTIFDSGNQTTIIRQLVVQDPSGPYGGANPTPVNGADAVDGAPPTGLIVKKDLSTGRWLDEGGADWSEIVTWDVHDHDLVTINVATLETSYVTGLMNINMALAVRPDGAVTVVGTDARNEVGTEPAARGRFVRQELAIVGGAAAGKSIIDLNPHLLGLYDGPYVPLPVEERAKSVADPRAIVWSADGQTGYVCGMGTNNVAKIDASGARLGQIDVAEGPTGLVLDESRQRLYVLSKFAAEIGVIELSSFTQSAKVAFFDPTPSEVKLGRPFLYDARLTSGLGITACGACHVDGRMDQLAWNLGDPGGTVAPFNQTCDNLLRTLPLLSVQLPCVDFHPMKGPMATQSLQGAVGQEPLHWRGDRASLSDFNPAFVSLNGNDRELTPDEMARFEAFLATITYPPNPYRHIDNSLDANSPFGDAERGLSLYIGEFFDARAQVLLNSQLLGAGNTNAIVSCQRCHELPTGTNHHIVPSGVLNEAQEFKVPHLRNMYQKIGFDRTSKQNRSGYGITHDGGLPSINEFFHEPVFDFSSSADADADRRDLEAFLMAFATDTHAGVGTQVTISKRNIADGHTQALIDQMVGLAEGGEVGLVVHGGVAGAPIGYAYVAGGAFATTKGEQLSVAAVRERASADDVQTWTLVPLGGETRLGVDANLNGIPDGLE